MHRVIYHASTVPLVSGCIDDNDMLFSAERNV